jgi:hypothetical protein
MRPSTQSIALASLRSAFVMLVSLAAACGPKAPAPAVGGTGPKTGAPAKPGVAAAATNETASSKAPKSVFVVDPKTSRDPFFPNAKYAQAAAPGVTNQVAKADLISMLDLQGILASGTDKVAFINNVGLEQGKTAQISLMLDGKEQKLRVKCLKIGRGTVDVLVEGHPQPVQLRVKR